MSRHQYKGHRAVTPFLTGTAIATAVLLMAVAFAAPSEARTDLSSESSTTTTQTAVSTTTAAPTPTEISTPTTAAPASTSTTTALVPVPPETSAPTTQPTNPSDGPERPEAVQDPAVQDPAVQDPAVQDPAVQDPFADQSVVLVSVAEPAEHVYRDDPCRTGCDLGTGVEFRQWHLEAMGVVSPPAERADGIVVAVVDGGVRADHPDLIGLVSRSVCAPDAQLTLDLEHGTNVAGLIAAIDGDGDGLAALVPGIRVLDIPVLGVEADGTHHGTASDIAAGIRCATAEGVDIINLSMAGSCVGAGVIADALVAAEAAGIVVVAAAGNVDLPTQPCPGVFPTVISVAAGRSDGTIAAGERWGDVLLPGFELLTASASELQPRTIVSGTSFAAPVLSAGIAALLGHHDDWTPARVRARVSASAEQVPGITVPGLLREDLFGAIVVTVDGRLIAVGDGTVTGDAPTTSAVDLVRVRCGGVLVAAADGGVFTYEGAQFFGSLGNIALAAPVVAIAATPSGLGYWMAAADGGVFAFGDAGFYGSLGAVRIDSPIVDLGVTPTGSGYWLLAADGQVYSFGDAVHRGSVLDASLSMVALSADEHGYVLTRRDGLSIALGDQPQSWAVGSVDGVVDAFLSRDGPVVLTAGGELVNASDGRMLFQSPTVVAAEQARPTSECSGSAVADADQ